MDKQTANVILHKVRIENRSASTCEEYDALDVMYDTPTNSPLHHSSRFKHDDNCSLRRK